MSLSLSSLLNPSPDADAQQQQTSSSSPTLARKNSLPPIQYVQSPVQDSTSPHTTHYPPSGHSYPPPAENDALQALATVSQWYPQQGQTYDRRSSGEQRPGSSGMQLPPPPPPTAMMDRKMSSPTLEQYHVAPRSPQERRHSLIAPPVQSHVVLPPIRGSSHLDQSGLSSSAQEHLIVNAPVTFASAEPHRVPADVSRVPLPPNPYISEHTTSSPAHIKQEALTTPRASSPVDAQQTPMKQSEGGIESVKAIASLKNEHGLRTQSPLRESSVPIQSTEISTPEPTIPKKRPAPSKTKKGTATMKKAPPTKKRKVEPKRSLTPSSRASNLPTFKTASSKGTPANSSPAPLSTRSQSASPDASAYDEDDDDEGPAGSDDELYCICRKPDNGTFMIGCDGTCDDWFHGKCVGVEEGKKHLIDKYICPRCTKAGVGLTTWKRMCRRSGCKQAAKIGKGKNGKEGSKYCSEECGVLFFREMVTRSRGKEDVAKHRSSRRKNSIIGGTFQDHQPDDIGALGGVLAAGELKALINTTKTADDFKKLGEGVLSPPSTPDSKSPSSAKKPDFTDSEAQSLDAIARQKDEARRKHTLLKDRMKFVQMAKQAASRTATEKELKPKEYCGYDSRIEWTEEQFGLWRASKAGLQAFDLETLSTEPVSSPTDKTKDKAKSPFLPPSSTDQEVEVLLQGVEICERKKCARHLEWPKLAIDDVRFEMGDNGDRMRGLDREEREVRERAALRGKKGVADGREGRVELHGLGLDLGSGKGEGMDVDG